MFQNCFIPCLFQVKLGTTLFVLSVVEVSDTDMIITMTEGSGTTIIRRNLPGTKAANYSQWIEEPFEEMDSTLAVQQYIQQTIRSSPQGTGV